MVRQQAGAASGRSVADTLYTWRLQVVPLFVLRVRHDPRRRFRAEQPEQALRCNAIPAAISPQNQRIPTVQPFQSGKVLLAALLHEALSRSTTCCLAMPRVRRYPVPRQCQTPRCSNSTACPLTFPQLRALGIVNVLQRPSDGFNLLISQRLGEPLTRPASPPTAPQKCSASAASAAHSGTPEAHSRTSSHPSLAPNAGWNGLPMQSVAHNGPPFADAGHRDRVVQRGWSASRPRARGTDTRSARQPAPSGMQWPPEPPRIPPVVPAVVEQMQRALHIHQHRGLGAKLPQFIQHAAPSIVH